MEFAPRAVGEEGCGADVSGGACLEEVSDKATVRLNAAMPAGRLAVDWPFGMTALGAHPFLESAEVDAVGLTILLGQPRKRSYRITSLNEGLVDFLVVGGLRPRP